MSRSHRFLAVDRCIRYLTLRVGARLSVVGLSLANFGDHVTRRASVEALRHPGHGVALPTRRRTQAVAATRIGADLNPLFDRRIVTRVRRAGDRERAILIERGSRVLSNHPHAVHADRRSVRIGTRFTAQRLRAGPRSREEHHG